MNAPLRRIAHLDMDAFYASVELLRYPQLQGLPVVIGGARIASSQTDPEADAPAGSRRLCDYTGRGVVTTASYAARRFGVRSAMGLMQAARLCPEAVLLPADFDQYRRYSRTFKQVITQFAPLIEDRGIDEVYIDFSSAEGGHDQGGRVLAQRIQQAIYSETGLTCSIGVAPNKLIAKMASEFQKPNGISIVYESELAQKIWPLSCRKISGIGPKAGERLEQLGIHTIGELARCDRGWLMGHFGANHGAWMREAAWGWDERPVVTHVEPVSMSRETTFARDLHAVHDRSELRSLLTALCERVSQDLQRHDYVARTIGIKLRYADFQRLTRDRTIDIPTNDATLIRRTAGLCLTRVRFDRRLRLLGVRAAGLSRVGSAAAAAAGGPKASLPETVAQPLELPLFGPY